MTGGPARRVVLDVDTGIDDALALLYAVASPAIDLCGVTTVSGNVPAGLAARNSAAVVAHTGAGDVPVATGASRTSGGEGPRTGPTNHGPDGLGGVTLAPGPEPSGAGVDRLLETAAGAGPVTLVGLAPLTNVAGLARWADDVVLVGGSLDPDGPPDFNAGHDPAATARVLAAGRSTTFYVLDVFEQVVVRLDDVARLRSSGRRAAQLAGELLAVRRAHLVGDAGALVLLTHPDLFRVEPVRMGMAGERLVPTEDGQLVRVVVDLDAAAVADAFVEVLLRHEAR